MSAGRCIVCPAGLVAEEGDRLCARCALDASVAGSHPMHCRCGPCLVYNCAADTAGNRRVWEWREVVAVLDGRRPGPATLAGYLAQRDADRKAGT